MAENNEQTRIVPATPEQIFDAWISGEGHTAMTGSPATSTPEVGGAFTAWNGFIDGSWEALERPSRIVMRWHTSAFPPGAPHSRVEVQLAPAEGGTAITVRHSNIPDGQGDAYFHGWQEKYFDPMRAHWG